ncbi:hypothetical protein HX017_15035 [Myroides marinus]|uniref:hypothetical protein n=1 Tax=Myroides TaxID=76831 RepID=UPI002578B23E|nr:hypothetical protein [Myroides marinus]MDM1348401.1 hypothetical protein [Myroides marinus]MDM1351916.1 hypothetical protein [Myroides marinus]MDM1359121.1 hypothetical protein [Myroides marinus]MDM1366254.1 hypothetical protein [Myroides marinus]MDM1373082.1 hypothetical protein [Myroides marinus]
MSSRGLSLSLILFALLTLFSCKKEIGTKDVEVEATVKDTTSFKMYEMSPLASLMEEMHAKGLFLKAQIEEGKTDFGTWPEKHKEILTAKMTDPSDMDLFFTYQAEEYLRLEKILYENVEGDKKEQFNNLINSCLECHQKKCGGPIPRIKKLLIK